LLTLLLTLSIGTVRGTVIEARTGAPLAAVLVRVQDTNVETVSDAEGRFEIAGVPAGPHTLVVSVVGYGLVRRDITVVDGEATEVTIALAEGASTYVEVLTVRAPLFRQAETGVAGQAVLGSRDLLALRGVLADDPFRAVQALPEVATGDDFEAEFAVRGLGPEHTGLALDGVDSPLLFHTVRGVNDSGSLALINTDILDSATLLSGAYPQRRGAHLGSRLDFTTRDGARDRPHARVLVSGTAATTVWEGPLGRTDRASWLVAFRQSYLDWLLREVDPAVEGTFGFTDGQVKLVVDATSRQQIRLIVVAGRSIFTENEADPGPNALDTARNRTLIGNLQWRYAPSPVSTFSQQLYAIGARYRNVTLAGEAREEGSDDVLAWRGWVERVIGAAQTIEIGAQAESLRASRLDRAFTARGTITSVDARGDHGTAAGWLHYRWTPHPSMTIAPGARVERFGLVDATVASPWVLGEWQATPAWLLRASAGVQHQSPTFDQALAAAGSSLRPERAWTLDAGVERAIGDAWRLRLNGYVRGERSRLRFERSEPQRDGDTIVRPVDPFWSNALEGSARGLALTAERRQANGISGWVSYAYGRADLDDLLTGESFPGDYDQTHTLNAYGIYRTSGRLSFSARFRYGSNFPIPGYYTPLGGDLYAVSTARNTTRLPDYARLDARADWAFTYRRSRLTLFLEAMNLFNRENLGTDDPAVNFTTGLVRNATHTLFPLLPSAGVLIEF
jgi:hypothetical protein